MSQILQLFIALEYQIRYRINAHQEISLKIIYDRGTDGIIFDVSNVIFF